MADVSDIQRVAQVLQVLLSKVPQKDKDSVATAKAYTDSVLTGLVNGSPDALKSLEDLANQLSSGGTPTLADLMSSFDSKADKTYVDTQDTSSVSEAKGYTDTSITDLGTSIKPLYVGQIPADTRGSNTSPNDYVLNNPKSIIREYKNCTDLGLPGSYFVDLLTFVPWDSINGGFPYQLATDTTSGDIYTRHGTSNTDWSSWLLLFNSDKGAEILATSTFNDVLGGDFS